jgi:hypothetical protein
MLARGANVNHVDHAGLSPVTSPARACRWGVVKVPAEHGGDSWGCDGHGKSGYDHLRRRRGERIRAEIEAVLGQRGPMPAADDQSG